MKNSALTAGHNLAGVVVTDTSVQCNDVKTTKTLAEYEVFTITDCLTLNWQVKL